MATIHWSTFAELGTELAPTVETVARTVQSRANARAIAKGMGKLPHSACGCGSTASASTTAAPITSSGGSTYVLSTPGSAATLSFLRPMR